MVFSAAIFLFLFLPVLLGLHFLSPHRLRNALLLVASLLFYAWGEKTYILVLLASIAVNYTMGRWLDSATGSRRRRWGLALAVAVNLGLLAYFKYGVFLLDNVNVARAALKLSPLPVPNLHLPLGISFFTFHALSYVIDVYRREVRALKDPFTFALYISFFPQSIAGPIVRYRDLAAQLVRRRVCREGFAEGVRRFVLGLSKKMLIANTLAVPADAIFALPSEALPSGMAWLGILCYTLQIYFDFSGYSDMAIGLAKMFGFDFKENFEYPYIARSITEFWRRWHISLSSWFRDYLYIPLGGNCRGALRTYLNLLIVFFLCGLWHGASWAFVCWGLYHGSFLVLERMGAGRLLERAWTPLRRVYTLLVVLIGWVFFRATTFAQAKFFLAALFGLGSAVGADYPTAVYLHTDVMLALLAGVLFSAPLRPLLQRLGHNVLEFAQPRGRWASALDLVVAGTSAAAYAVLLSASAMLLAAGTHNPFIYFRF
ncbi:MAG TPA: MBOAT family protein [Gemmataceae bacterium]|nr:MBOAT family protein [Gemmataceae bacterium]